MTTASTEKQDKRKANRKLRRVERKNPEEAPKHVRAVADVWSFAKDGKHYYAPVSPTGQQQQRRMMRK